MNDGIEQDNWLTTKPRNSFSESINSKQSRYHRRVPSAPAFAETIHRDSSTFPSVPLATFSPSFAKPNDDDDDDDDVVVAVAVVVVVVVFEDLST